MIRRIACAVDLEAGTDRVVQMAADLTRQYRTELLLLYVIDSPLLTLKAGSGPLHLPEDEAEEVGRASLQLREQAVEALQSLARSISPNASSKVLEGTPIDTKILEEIERYRPDLVVIGSHGRRGIKRLLGASISDRIVHESPIPVLVVKRSLDAAKAPADS